MYVDPQIDNNNLEHDKRSRQTAEDTGTIKLYPQQQQALEAICNFLDSDNEVFILRGYAGTGKTTMVKALLPELKRRDKSLYLMAPTGRAAKVLSDKTGHEAHTIHSCIYDILRLTSVRHDKSGELIKMSDAFYKDVEEKRKHDTVELWFDLKHHGFNYIPDKSLYIIDESSMISSRETKNENLHFGSDNLLNDLLEYAELRKGGKIVFIGDPAQLPPVGDNTSAALTEEFFTSKGLKVSSFELTEVIRQAEDSTILKNAMMVRDLLNSSQRNRLSFIRCKDEVEDISATSMVDKYVESNPTPRFGQSIIICFSNSTTKSYNDAIRSHYYPGSSSVQPGDILQVVKNCTAHLSTDSLESAPCGILYNGDFVRVLEVSEHVETQSALVWTKIGDKQDTVSLTYREVVIQTENGDILPPVKIIDSLLNDTEPRLTQDQTTSQYINFRMRNPKLPNDREAMAQALAEDPYCSALHVKYGYAITGHKSQGGDWNTVFVEYAGRTGLDNDSLRWVYTATTRAKKRLYGCNMPNIQPLDKLQIRPIQQVGKHAANARCIVDVGSVERLSPNATLSQKAKYLSAEAALNRIGFRIECVEQMPYKDRYHIAVENGIERYDCIYNGAGYYTSYTPLEQSSNTQQIMEALQSEERYEYRFDYTPSSDALALLYAKVQSVADEIGVKITNVVEEIKQYYILYHLKTSGKFARIKFYFNANHFITSAQPESDLGDADDLLQLLIQKLK